jgi:RNA repair pathway DNA polymerase beta family
VDLRIKHLANLDPQAVALPHGTEVVTRVDRVVGERRIPQGTIGRVVKIDGDELDVAVVGVGTLRYARRELSPRRVGQVLYAQRRERAWDALLPCVVLDTPVGSHAWGLAGEGSDDDRRGVFAHPLPWTLGLVAPPEDLVREDGSATYWAYGKAIRQALRADPNTLEALFVPAAVATDPIGEWILDARDAFVSTEIYGSFGRYALGQLRRLEQGQRLAEHRTTVLEWLRLDPTLTLDAVAEKLARLSPRAAPTEADAVHQAKQYVKQLYRSLFDQGLLEAAELRALAKLACEAPPTLELPRELRPKNAYNLLRLIATATGWLREGTPTFEMEGALKRRLLAIKHGNVPISEVLVEAEAMTPELEAARDASRLPARSDIARADALVRRIGEEVARRWTERSPGPFGAQAPAPPEAVWSD